MMRSSATSVLLLVSFSMLAGCQVPQKQDQALSGNLESHEGRIFIDHSDYAAEVPPEDPASPQAAGDHASQNVQRDGSARHKAIMWNPATAKTNTPPHDDARRHSFPAPKAAPVAAAPLPKVTSPSSPRPVTVAVSPTQTSPKPPAGIVPISPVTSEAPKPTEAPKPKVASAPTADQASAPPGMEFGVASMMK